MALWADVLAREMVVITLRQQQQVALLLFLVAMLWQTPDRVVAVVADNRQLQTAPQEMGDLESW
jgi:hypothetical protein